MYSIMSSANGEILLIFFYFYSFTYFSCLIVVARTSSTKSNKSGESEHPCLAPDIRGNAFSFSPLSLLFAVVLSCMAFIMLRYIPSMPTFWRVLS